MGETRFARLDPRPESAFSILERIDVGETMTKLAKIATKILSVSSNGSTWVKPNCTHLNASAYEAFSILERIDVGETGGGRRGKIESFSTFSILERIDVGETAFSQDVRLDVRLSVSSNGSTWVKLQQSRLPRRAP